jgi:BirA family biotin operon repressor/biotin-[acetyl-CoA-carboxylase] ligase
LERLNFWYQRFANSNFDANKSGLRQAAIAACVSLGQEVRAILPGDTEILGSAITIDDTGRLVIEANSEVVTVAAGDIVHLRHN